MFENKNALISGGSSGIGLALAKQLFSLGSSITILARRKDLLKKALFEIEKERINSHQTSNSISADVSIYDELKSALEKDRPAADSC
jgi:NAD(P)-dependent dehydrogenase (short-subunit alcohol dehydrogenase family)